MAARRIVAMVAVALCLCAAAGCTISAQRPSYAKTQFQVLVASETGAPGAPHAVLTEKAVQEEVERLLSLRPPSAAPDKVVLHEVSSSPRTKIKSAQKWLELREETSKKMKAALEETGIFQQVEFLPDVLIPEGTPSDLKILRIAAARAQAHAVLVYSTEAGYEMKPNSWAVLYATIVGAFFVPGTEVSSMALSKAVLLDVRTGYFYLMAETYASASATTSPPLLAERWQELEFNARKDSLSDLAASVAAKVRDLEAPDQPK